VDGEEWLRKSGESKVKRWGKNEVELYNKVIEASESCFDALMGCQQQKYFDMDGATYVESLVELSEQGRAYMTKVVPSEGPPTEPLYESLRLLRDKLSLVGFSDATVRAGREDLISTRRNNIVGGERALAEQLVQFRSAVRKYALDNVRNDGGSSLNGKEILRLCDEARDDILPSMGLELNDDKIEGDSTDSNWRFCLPRERKTGSKSETRTVSSVPIIPDDTPVEDLFRVGQYEGQFSSFDKDGIPTHNIDGSEVSKTLRKKLYKKREKYQKRKLER
jgi:cysteinyl-tRNA synthetase